MRRLFRDIAFRFLAAGQFLGQALEHFQDWCIARIVAPPSLAARRGVRKPTLGAGGDAGAPLHQL